MDLKIFPNNIILLKVDRFEGFSNRSNVDELVINSMSGCNQKIAYLIITITNLTTLHENSVLLFWVLSNLEHKYPFHIAICLQNLVHFQLHLREIMHDSLKHVITLCYHSYLSIWNNLATTTLASTPYHIVTKQGKLKRGRRSKKRNEILTKTPLV